MDNTSTKLRSRG